MTSLQAVGLSWLAAAAAFPAALVLATLGQAAGAALGGCTWIGVSVPVHRQVWAVVNEPSVAFAHLARAWGYWLGSAILPGAVAALAVPLLPRRHTVAAELGTVGLAWAAAAGALGILPVLDGAEGHVARWLALRHLPAVLVWGVPLLAVPVALPAVLRLLALDREAVPTPSRSRRTAVVVLHLVLPAGGWLLLVSTVRGALPPPAAVGLMVACLGALLAAFLGVPRRLGARYEAPGTGAFLRLLLAAAVLWGLLAVAGRPLPGGRAAAVLWGRPRPTCNIRSWMTPVPLPWTGTVQEPASSSR